MTTILLTGANGFVGSHVLPALLAAGHDVVALVRDRQAGDAVHAPLAQADRARVTGRLGDVTEPATLPAALRGCEAVVHLVAIPRDQNGGRDLLRVNTEGTRNMVDAARAAGVRRFVHQSAMGVTEDPALHYATSKARAEDVVRHSGLDWTILKPSLLWGQGDGFFSLIAMLARWSPGVIAVPGNGRARFQPLWVEDLARVVAEVLASDITVGHTYELGGPAYWTYTEITREVLAALGKQRLIVPMPVPLISLVAGGAETLHLPFPVATDQLRQLKLDNIGPLHGIEQHFGFRPRPMNGHLGYLRRNRRRPGGASRPSTARA
jgi:NADH dehydrogenase